MLMPRKVKHRKTHRGRLTGQAKGGTTVDKGDILPYKSQMEDKIAREAAMAVGETSGQGAPRRVVSSAGRRQTAGEAEVPEAPAEVEAPLLKEADPDLERLLAEEEEIERRTRESHETPHFRPGED